MKIRVKVHVFDDDAVNEPPRVAAQIQKLKDDFDDWNIILDISSQLYQPSPYAVVTSEAEVQAMKNVHADSPATKLNIYVTKVLVDEDGNGVPDYAAKATFPWDPNAAGTQGGIVITGKAFGGNKTTLTHEIGHCLSLWHTHHGTCEAELVLHGGCGPPPQGPVPCLPDSATCDCVCYEAVDSSFRDYLGDFCADTASTPVNFSCGAPAFQDDP